MILHIKVVICCAGAPFSSKFRPAAHPLWSPAPFFGQEIQNVRVSSLAEGENTILGMLREGGKNGLFFELCFLCLSSHLLVNLIANLFVAFPF